MSKPPHVRSDFVDIMVNREGITLGDQAVVALPAYRLQTVDVTAQQYHLRR